MSKSKRTTEIISREEYFQLKSSVIGIEKSIEALEKKVYGV